LFKSKYKYSATVPHRLSVSAIKNRTLAAFISKIK
jgi:hypothetical protein